MSHCSQTLIDEAENRSLDVVFKLLPAEIQEEAQGSKVSLHKKFREATDWIESIFAMDVDFRRIGGARALQIPRQFGRLGFGAATDGAGQGHR